METSGKHRLLIAWSVLVAITLSYVWVDGRADGDGALVASTTATVAAVGLALVKLRIIMRELMDVRRAPMLLRRSTDLLLVVIAVALLSSYVIGKAAA